MLTGGATESPATIQLADDSNGWDGGRRPAAGRPWPHPFNFETNSQWRMEVKIEGMGPRLVVSTPIDWSRRSILEWLVTLIEGAVAAGHGPTLCISTSTMGLKIDGVRGHS